jgi:mannosyltransferase
VKHDLAGLPRHIVTFDAAAKYDEHSMSNRLAVTLDCVIFGLQRFGGISNYWMKLVEHACATPTMHWTLVQPRTMRYHFWDNRPLAHLDSVQEQLTNRWARYLAAPVNTGTDVFHTSYYRLPCRPVSRFVVTAYDFTYERYGTGLARVVHSAQKLRSLRRADAVICISESTRRDVLEFCGGIDADRVHVVPLGVDTNTYFCDPIVPDSGLDRVVLFVGQRTDYKRFDLAIKAVRACRDLKLGIVGPELNLEERAVLQQSLHGRWHAFGPVSAGELRKLYSTAFALIFPSDYEGFGLPILEAMACGCPVLAANSSSLPEVGGSAALYAAEQHGDTYAKLLQDLGGTTCRSSLVQAGFERVFSYSWSHTVERTMSIYRGE